MPALQTYVGANDNSPAWIMSRRPRDVRPNPYIARKTPRTATQTSFKLTQMNLSALMILLSAAGLIAILACWLFGIEAATAIWPVTAIGIMTTIFAVFARLKTWHRTSNLSALAACAAFPLALSYAASLSGLTHGFTDLAAAASIIGVALAALTRSRTALLCSLFASGLWVASLFPALQGDLGLETSAKQSWWIVAPFVIWAQLILSDKFRSLTCIALSVALAYGWAMWLAVSAGVPPIAIAGLIFAIGFAHHRWGKSSADQDRHAGRLHTILGWGALVVAVMCVQAYWLSPTSNATTASWTPNMGWWMAVGLASIMLFASSIIRYTYAQISLSGVFILNALMLLLPLATIYPESISAAFDAVPGLSPAPGFGIVLGAAVMASGLGWIINGLRRTQTLDIFLGVAVVGLQALVLFQPRLTNLDFGILFTFTLIGALAIGGLIAGNLSQAQPAPRQIR